MQLHNLHLGVLTYIAWSSFRQLLSFSMDSTEDVYARKHSSVTVPSDERRRAPAQVRALQWGLCCPRHNYTGTQGRHTLA